MNGYFGEFVEQRRTKGGITGSWALTEGTFSSSNISHSATWTFCSNIIRWTWTPTSVLVSLQLFKTSSSYWLETFIPAPAGPPLSSASSPWRCPVPALCSVPTAPVTRPCPPHAPLSAPLEASCTPACKTGTRRNIYIRFRVGLIQLDSFIKSGPILHVEYAASLFNAAANGSLHTSVWVRMHVCACACVCGWGGGGG